MKNVLFYGLLVVVAVILGLIVYGVYVSLAAPGADVTQAVCGATFIIVVLVAVELLMKPGVYLKRREPAEAPPPVGPPETEDPRTLDARRDRPPET